MIYRRKIAVATAITFSLLWIALDVFVKITSQSEYTSDLGKFICAILANGFIVLVVLLILSTSFED